MASKRFYLYFVFIVALFLLVGCSGGSDSSSPATTSSDITPPVITLSGDVNMSISQNSTFTDPGATATDDVDGSVSVVVTGSVDTSTVGVYTLTYTAQDSAGNKATATRVVNISYPVDITPPVITLSGDVNMSISQNSTFTDPGATATDDVDGSVNVTMSGSVDTSTIGIYTLTYTAKDSAGNIATATRTVNVIFTPDISPPVIVLNGDANMSILQNSTFTDPGATATDDRDASVSVVVTGSVDTSTVGAYILTYTAQDSAGNIAASGIRGVNVLLPSDTTSYSYDDVGRLIKVDYGNNLTIEYTYDKNGNLLKRERNGGVL